MEIGVWEDYTKEHNAFYGPGGEGKCYEIALFDGDVQVGNTTAYRTFMASGADHSFGWDKFGLTLKIKKIKEYRKPSPKPKDESTDETVIIKHFDRHMDELIGLEHDHRAVYRNTKGRYIKTRSKGRVYLTIDEPPTIHYVGGRAVPPQ